MDRYILISIVLILLLVIFFFARQNLEKTVIVVIDETDIESYDAVAKLANKHHLLGTKVQPNGNSQLIILYLIFKRKNAKKFYGEMKQNKKMEVIL